MVIGVPKETALGEARVAQTPETVAKLTKQGFEVIVEQNAGVRSYFSDEAYQTAGATLGSAEQALGADFVTKVAAPSADELAKMKHGAGLIAFLRPLDDLDVIRQLAHKGITSYAMELVPRSTKAQKMDALSAMASIAGYKAVLLAAEIFPRFFPLLTTAAGTIKPASVLVLGAGVAGLQALATARRLGAVTSAYDVRAAAAEEAKSLGAKFIELDLDTSDASASGGYAAALSTDRAERQVQLLATHIAKMDVVISTALIPGRKAPLLISEDAVKAMAPGSVIIDIAAPNGGNCALTVPGETVVRHEVTIVGAMNLPAGMPFHASQLYARTILAGIGELVKEGAFRLDFDDEIVKGCCVTHQRMVVHERVKSIL